MSYIQMLCGEMVDWDGFIDAVRAYGLATNAECGEPDESYNWDGFVKALRPASPETAADNALSGIDWDMFGAAIHTLRAA